jgi:hypothetical protein
MISPGNDDCKLSEERACSTFFLTRWRRELLIQETEGDADAIELVRRVLDYYLDQYTQPCDANSYPRKPMTFYYKHDLDPTGIPQCCMKIETSPIRNAPY